MDSSTRRRLFRDLLRAGWRVEKGRSNHFKIWNPDGLLITTTGSTPSDCFGAVRLLADLRRAGFHWPPSGGRKAGRRRVPKQRTNDRGTT